MSEERARKFFKQVEEDASLGEEYKSLLMGCKELSEDAVLDRVVRFAEEREFSFSAEDTKALARSMQPEELSDEDLSQVAGGGRWKESAAWVFMVVAGHTGPGAFCLIVGLDQKA